MEFQISEIKAFCKASGIKSLLQTKPIEKGLKTYGLKYRPILEKDTVQFAGKEATKTNTEADMILEKLKENYQIEYFEERVPEVIENVKAGNICTYSDLQYSRYKKLEAFRKENPDTFVLFGKDKGSPLSLQNMMNKYGDTPIQIAKDVPLDQITQTFAEIEAFGQKHRFKPEFNHYMNMLILKRYNPKTYKYIMSTPDITAFLAKRWGKDVPSVAFFKTITPEQMQAMVNDRIPNIKNIGAYVESSDAFVKDKKAIQDLSEDLAKCKLSKDLQAYRGEKTVGMFDSVSIDEDLQKQIRQLLETNKVQAKNARITTYNGIYNCEPSTNLYDFLSSKETLTLADAMQMAKYGDEKFINEILSRLQKAKVVDTRFKSFSFDKGMASSWRGIHAGDNTTIIQNATLKKGTQGGYQDGPNAQYEVILNNTPKEINVQNTVYNKETDTFELNTTIRNIK